MLDFEEFVEAVKGTLKYWLDLHTDPETWAEEWTCGCELQWAVENSPIFENDYFTFRWKDAALTRYAEELVRNNAYVRCTGCGSLWDNSFYDCDCTEDHDLDCEVIEDPGVIVEMWDDLGFDVEIPTQHLWYALINEGFETYRQGIGPLTYDIEQEIKDVLDDMEAAQTGEEFLNALVWALHIQHVQGTITKDYGDRCDIHYQDIDIVQQDGLLAIFDQEEIDDYIEDYYPEV